MSKPVFSDPAQQEWYEERAAILEFDAGMTRQQAERQAAQEVAAKVRQAPAK